MVGPQINYYRYRSRIADTESDSGSKLGRQSTQAVGPPLEPAISESSQIGFSRAPESEPDG